jgi:pyruvate/2-oxoglutarate dehydrogenase complex dihydrolipoamide acyltransferase (E2) component
MRSLSTRAAGLLILIMGIWGGLVPFVGPYFHFAMGPDKSWTWTSGRFWLDVLPGIVALLGGLMLIGAGPRMSGKLGALLALAAGVWFAIGPDVSLLWNSYGAQGAAHGAKGTRVLEMITYHTLLGAVMAALAGYALPGFVRRRAVVAEPAAAGTTAAAARTPRTRAREEEVAAEDRRVAAEDRRVAAEDGAVDRREPVGATTARNGAATTTRDDAATTTHDGASTPSEPA